MKKTIRYSLAIIILAISFSLLVWAYAPNPHKTRSQTVDSSEMRLP